MVCLLHCKEILSLGLQMQSLIINSTLQDKWPEMLSLLKFSKGEKRKYTVPCLGWWQAV